MIRGRVCSALAAAIIAAGVSSRAPAQSPIYSLNEGSVLNEGFGYAVAGAGDLDQDGYADLLVRGASRVWVISGHSGIDMHVLQGNGAFGTALAGGADANGDGHPDLLIGDWSSNTPLSGVGAASIYSGTTFTLLKALSGDSANDFFGCAVRWAGDVDGDGRADALVGSYGDDASSGGEGSAKVVSSATKTVLAQAFGAADAQAGWSVAAVGDNDGDGVPDFAFGSLYGGSCRIASGASGALLREIKLGNFSFGRAIDAAGDVDLDGVTDLVIGESEAPWPVSSSNAGAAHIVSGAHGGALFSFTGAAANDYFGYGVAGIGDVNDDGHPDVAVSSFQQALSPWGTPPAYARVYSGADGRMLFGVASDLPTFGRSIAAAGDLNRDGTPDFVVGAPKSNGPGAAIAFSGRPLFLSSYQHDVSTLLGGVQVADLRAGPSTAGKPYLLIGTASGTVPGTPVDALLVPLNIDAYTLYSIANPNVAPLTQSLGVLDAAGSARARVEFPAGLSGLPSGLVLEHAFVVLDAGTVIAVSNPLPLAFDS